MPADRTPTSRVRAAVPGQKHVACAAAGVRRGFGSSTGLVVRWTRWRGTAPCVSPGCGALTAAARVKNTLRMRRRGRAVVLARPAGLLCVATIGAVPRFGFGPGSPPRLESWRSRHCVRDGIAMIRLGRRSPARPAANGSPGPPGCGHGPPGPLRPRPARPRGHGPPGCGHGPPGCGHGPPGPPGRGHGPPAAATARSARGQRPPGRGQRPAGKSLAFRFGPSEPPRQLRGVPAGKARRFASTPPEAPRPASARPGPSRPRPPRGPRRRRRRRPPRRARSCSG